MSMYGSVYMSQPISPNIMTSAVWRFWERKEGPARMTCQLCCATLATHNCGNAKKHMRYKHPTEFAIVQAEDESGPLGRRRLSAIEEKRMKTEGSPSENGESDVKSESKRIKRPSIKLLPPPATPPPAKRSARIKKEKSDEEIEDEEEDEDDYAPIPVLEPADTEQMQWEMMAMAGKAPTNRKRKASVAARRRNLKPHESSPESDENGPVVEPEVQVLRKTLRIRSITLDVEVEGSSEPVQLCFPITDRVIDDKTAVKVAQVAVAAAATNATDDVAASATATVTNGSLTTNGILDFLRTL